MRHGPSVYATVLLTSEHLRKAHSPVAAVGLLRHGIVLRFFFTVHTYEE